MGQCEASAAKRLITLVSTHTRDRIPAPRGGEPVEIPGGPAHYIGRALERLNWPHELITGEVAAVEVLADTEGHQYVIPAIKPIDIPPELAADAVILSPIIGEIDPNAIPEVDGLLVVDVQGFVREPFKPSGTVTRRFDLSNLLRRAAIVKGSDAELALLSEDSRTALEHTILIRTRGSRGSLILDHGREYRVQARRIRVENTIGAGDTFLAGFVCAVLQGCSSQEAGRKASRFTEAVLTERLRSEQE